MGLLPITEFLMTCNLLVDSIIIFIFEGIQIDSSNIMGGRPVSFIAFFHYFHDPFERRTSYSFYRNVLHSALFRSRFSITSLSTTKTYKSRNSEMMKVEELNGSFGFYFM